MKPNVEINEFAAANKFVREQFKGHENVPTALAMFSAGVAFLIQSGQQEGWLRQRLEDAILVARNSGKIAMPSPAETAKIIGLDEEKRK